MGECGARVVFDKKTEVGSGGFSHVFKGVLKAGTPCAIKVINKKIFNKPEDKKDMEAEVAIMTKLKGSPYVISIYESLETVLPCVSGGIWGTGVSEGVGGLLPTRLTKPLRRSS